MKIYPYFLFVFILFCFNHVIDAQTFSKAPKDKRKIKKITEWLSDDLHAKTQKGYSYDFDWNGKLLKYVKGNEEEVGLYKYDGQERLIKLSIQQDELDIEKNFIYNQNQRTKIESFRSRKYKTIDYFNDKGKKIEEKIFIQGEDVGNKWMLKDRFIYTYNDKHKLKGKMHYSYRVQGGGQKIIKRKTLYFYDPIYHKIQKIQHYDYNGVLRKTREYTYNQAGKTKWIKESSPKNESTKQIEYIYKNGILSQEIEEDNNFKSVKIYKDGRLIRLRTYLDNKALKMINYQYVFY